MDQNNSRDDKLFEALDKSKKKKKRKIIRTVIIIVVCLAVALTVGVFYLRKQVTKRFASNDNDIVSAEATIGSISTQVSGSGSLVNMDEESIKIPAGVTVAEILVSANDIVTEGQLLVKTLLCGTFSMLLANYLPGVAKWLTWIGAAYMVYLAVIMMMSGWKETKDSGGKYSGGTVRDGISLQIFNGKSWMVAISMFAVYVTPISTGFGAVLFATILFASLAIVSSLIWTAFGWGLHDLIAKFKKPFGIVMGLALIWCAVKAVL